METSPTNKLLRERFPSLSEPLLIDEILENGDMINFSSGDVLINFGHYIKSIPLVLSGNIKILREDKSGKELFLYYLKPGETCAMSLTCCMANHKSEIKAIAEEDSLVIMIPVKYLDVWTGKYISWKNMIMTTYQNRFNELLNTIDGIAFSKLDERLINYLTEKSETVKNNIINQSHQEIANELGTQREVISRLLKKLEKEGVLQLGRNKIEIVDFELLQNT